MKYFLKDLGKLSIILIIWYYILNYLYNSQNYIAYESIKYFPFHLIITIGYYAIISICYKILFINDCEKEHQEISDEIEEGRKFFINKNIKYN
jgi:hypothetical protein